MRCGAPLFAIVFPVATPDHAPVWIVGVPHLAPVKTAAIAADDHTGKTTGAVAVFRFSLSLSHLILHQVKHLGRDNGGVAVFDIVHRDLPLVDLGLLHQEINRKGLLEDRRTLVLFVAQDALHSADRPLCATGGGRNPIPRQLPGNRGDRLPIEKGSIDAAHDFCFFLHDLRKAVLPPCDSREIACRAG